MAKRRADKQLTHENYDQEDDDESSNEPGVFVPAPKDKLETRKIATAKRRITGSVNSSSDANNSGIGGGIFGAFKFGSSNFTPADTNKKDGRSDVMARVDTQERPAKITQSTGPPAHSQCKEIPKRVEGKDVAEKKAKELYLAKLKALNVAMLEHLNNHLKQNFYLDLSPVFADYTTHFRQIEEEFAKAKKGSEQPSGPKARKVEAGMEAKDQFVTQLPSFSTGSEGKPLFGTSATSQGFSFEVHKSTGESVGTHSWKEGLNGHHSLFKDSTASSELNKSSDSKPLFGLSASSGQTGRSGAKFTPLFGMSDSGATGSSGSLFKFGAGSEQKKDASATAASPPTFNFGIGVTRKEPSISTETAQHQPTFSFGTSSESSGLHEGPGGSSTRTTDVTSSQFFANPASNKSKDNGGPQSETQGTSQEAEDEEPPKPEFVKADEPDAFHDTKCRLYYFKEGKYVDKGIGTLYLKKCGDKTQLLIRDGSSLGTILLNIHVSKDLNAQTKGKNSLTIVCVPNPPLNPKDEVQDQKPVTMLIRCTTSEAAKELLAKIEESSEQS